MNGQRKNTDGRGNAEPKRVDREGVQRLERHVWRRIVSGFFVLIPLLITVLVLKLIIDFVDGFFRPFFFVKDKPYDVPGIGVLFSLVALYVIGLLVSSKGHGKVAQWQNAVMSRVPIVRSIYGVAKQATDALSSPSGRQFSRVVFIEWPREGVLAMGFVTGHFHSPVDDAMLLAVYIPTAPNPTSGMLAFVSERDIIETEITVDKAMKIVFSGGIVLPHSLRTQPSESLTGPPTA